MTPRYYQKEATDATIDYIQNGNRQGVIVIPTGAGKSYVQASLARIFSSQSARCLLLTHQKTLIDQNYKEFKGIVPLSDAGIYSAGLNRRDTDHQVLFAGIQSVHKKALHLGRFDVVMVDEAHLINNKAEGTYRKFLDKQFEMNPNLVLLGLSATPFRLKGGYLNYGDEAIFKDIIYDVPVGDLMTTNNPDGKQYLATLISKRSVSRVDLSDVKLVAGDYNQGQMETAFDKVVRESVTELLAYTHDRKKVLIFAAGIKHAEHIKSLIPGCGIYHGNSSEHDFQLFQQGELKYIVNVQMMTTGTNIPDIDCIALMRATKSPGLYIQMVGRGTRLADGKDNCLVLDFGDNVATHGPIDKVIIRNPSQGKGENLGPPIKECPQCHSLINIQARYCPDCGFVFPENPKHNETASELNVISERLPPEKVEVVEVVYSRHSKEGKPDSMRVDYYKGVGLLVCSEYICLEHGGYAGRKAMEWVEDRGIDELEDIDELGNIVHINTVSELLKVANQLKKPSHITVDYNGKYAQIVEYEFEEILQEA